MEDGDGAKKLNPNVRKVVEEVRLEVFGAISSSCGVI